ncbi:hypothetical protein GCM10011491_43190 [Brucella endophytica]|uniref:Uncharacterized protein n=1 Tax=Brucella endophytica TaxID=1963359 RepID=A0A916WL86_9HYPH|nr:hypothetical protein [Brucella endophytica]GGB10630.1 hypothetical protein GCM10011491_43190 [Brucella endophytica]
MENRRFDIRKSLLRALFASLCGVSANAMATEQYPCKPAPDEGRFAWGRIQSIDPNYLVKRILGPYTFKIPYGYMIGRPTPERLNCYPKQNRLEFAFWMPDFRAPKKDMWSEPNYRVHEPGRDAPGPQEYVVDVVGLEFIETKAGKSGSPGRRFVNGLALLRKDFRIEETYGLIHVVPGQNTPLSDDYVSLSNEGYEILLECSRPESRDSNPSCKAYLYFTDLQLEAVMQFPADALPEWQKIKDGVRILVERWIVKEKPT